MSRVRTPYEEEALERERVAARQAKQSARARSSILWFGRPAPPVQQPEMFRWVDVADAIPLEMADE